MDLNRFSVAIERKLAGDLSAFLRLKKEIDILNLNTKQLILLNTPAVVIRLFKKVQFLLLRLNIYLTPFK
jgi:hypothetical protein